MAEEKAKTYDAKVMAKGQITIPKEIREKLNLKPGSRVYFLVEQGEIKLVSPFEYFLKTMQKEFAGQAEKAEFKSEEELNDYITEMRQKGWKNDAGGD